ncbi:hypothetical protein GCM10022221_02830 [Actinocorallia aurea]
MAEPMSMPRRLPSVTIAARAIAPARKARIKAILPSHKRTPLIVAALKKVTLIHGNRVPRMSTAADIADALDAVDVMRCSAESIGDMP